ncbi:hypothetical protein TNCV_3488851 [Trichonephila clavipes]|nr:hypothetical protein TNCV_3488851 [Trichonephila clavipes]
MSSSLVLSEGDTRNRWRDGQVCPDVGQRTMVPWARRPGRRGRRERKRRENGGREEKGRTKKERGRVGDGKREEKESGREREEPALCLEKRAESGDWSEKDDERRWLLPLPDHCGSGGSYVSGLERQIASLEGRLEESQRCFDHLVSGLKEKAEETNDLLKHFSSSLYGNSEQAKVG